MQQYRSEHIVNPNEDLRQQYISQAAELVKEAEANDGLAPVDLAQFWKDQEIAGRAPFGRHIPQCALGIWMSSECVFDELGVPEDTVRFRDNADWAMELTKRYNDRSEKIVGRRLLHEARLQPGPHWPDTKRLHDVFEARNVWRGASWWLQESATNPQELKSLLDRVEKRNENLRDFILPEDWDDRKAELQKAGVPAPGYSHQRGPVTFAASVYGPENLIFLIIDDEALAGRFRDLIIRTMTGIHDILDEEAGQGVRRGFSFADDNCCLMTPDMYEFFGAPVLQAMFDKYAHGPNDWRYQHSDSDMAHLLPILGRFNLQGCNFGPKITVAEIRAHMPNTVIEGQLAPFTFSRNEEVNIVAEFLRDFDQAREKRGLKFATAGSINNGSRLSGMRLIMAAIQRWGRY